MRIIIPERLTCHCGKALHAAEILFNEEMMLGGKIGIHLQCERGHVVPVYAVMWSWTYPVSQEDVERIQGTRSLDE